MNSAEERILRRTVHSLLREASELQSLAYDLEQQLTPGGRFSESLEHISIARVHSASTRDRYHELHSLERHNIERN